MERFEAEDRWPLVAPEALRDEERADEVEVFGLLDDWEVLVDEFEVSSVLPVKLDLDDDACSSGLVYEDGIGLPITPRDFVEVPRLHQ